MSSLSNLPYGSILDYWYEKLKNNKHKHKFILTKILEIYSFSKEKQELNNLISSEGKIIKSKLKNNIKSCPKVSVIIPTYIRTEFDQKCLTRLIEILLNQTSKIENILIIDDKSPLKYNIPQNIKVKLIKQDRNKGPANARNKGIESALNFKSDIIVFTDVDCVPTENWIENIINEFITNKTAHIISGNTKSYNKNWLGIYHEINGTLNGRKFKDSDLLLYGPTCNLAITKEVGEMIRFNLSFPNAAGEDIEFCFRALKYGFNIFHSKQAIVYHDYGYKKLKFIKNLKSFMTQFKKYSKGEKILLQEIPDYYSYFENTLEISSYK